MGIGGRAYNVLAGRLDEPEGGTELGFGDGEGAVDLVAEDQERRLCQVLDRQEAVELLLRLGESLPVRGVHEEDDAVGLRVVVLPEAAGLRVPAEVVRVDLQALDDELLGRGVRRRVEGDEAAVAEHVQQGRLAGVVQAEEEDLAALIPQAYAVRWRCGYRDSRGGP